MGWIFEVDIRRVPGGYLIIPSVKQAPRPGVYGKGYSPYKTWSKAVEAFKAEVLVQHKEGDVYLLDGNRYTDPEELLSALKEPS